mmetsp:Transcript_2457/g.5587  ORF Transcript_2457/g.5587 Transcript_2457/m.5587 type:complete len:282 (-) Transcript_2457:14-859(-)
MTTTTGSNLWCIRGRLNVAATNVLGTIVFLLALGAFTNTGHTIHSPKLRIGNLILDMEIFGDIEIDIPQASAMESDLLSALGDEMHNDGASLVRVKNARILGNRGVDALPNIGRADERNVRAIWNGHLLDHPRRQLLPISSILETQIFGNITQGADKVSLSLEEVVPGPLGGAQILHELLGLIGLVVRPTVRDLLGSTAAAQATGTGCWSSNGGQMMRIQRIGRALILEVGYPSVPLVGAGGPHGEGKVLIADREHMPILRALLAHLLRVDLGTGQRHGPH